MSYQNNQQKGKQAEEAIYKLVQKALLADWCYSNPCFQDGELSKELCDILVIYESTAIIWQVKHVKVDSSTKTYKGKDFGKISRQLTGARNKLMEQHEGLPVRNNISGEKTIYPSDIENVYLIAVFWGNEEENYCKFHESDNEKLPINVLNQDGSEKILDTLDTIGDFVEYLKAREYLFTRCKHVDLHREADLLACFLLDRNLSKLPRQYPLCIIPDGIWERLTNSEQFAHYKQNIKISEAWDKLIEASREFEDERIKEELCSLNRLQRRDVSEIFIDTMMKAMEDKSKRDFSGWLPLDDLGVTYCFWFIDEYRFWFSDERKEERKLYLENYMRIFRGKFPQNEKVVAVATGQTFCDSITFGIYPPQWTNEDAVEARKLEKYFGDIAKI